MEFPKIYMTHHGKWEGSEYIGGVTELALMPESLTFDDLINLVHEVCGYEYASWTLELHVKFDMDGRSSRLKVKSDREVQYLLSTKENGIELFVTASAKAGCGYMGLMASQMAMGNPELFTYHPPNQYIPVIEHSLSSQYPESSYNGGDDDDHGRDDNEDEVEDDEDHDNEDDRNDFYDGDFNYNYSNDEIEQTENAEFCENMNEPEFRRDWEIPGSSGFNFVEGQSSHVQAADGVIAVGAMFPCKEDLKMSLGNLALKEKFTYKIMRSSTNRFEVSCPSVDCSFKLKAKPIGTNSMWIVKKWERSHTCESSLSIYRPRNVPYSVISSLISPKLVMDGRIIRPRDVVGEMQVEHGVDVLYCKAWRATEKAKNMVYGDAVDSFKRIPSLLYMLEHTNPGTVTNLTVDEDNRFEYCFVALGASINGWKYCRHVIVVDATHLKGKYKGTMFVAATKDGNNQIYPLAFGFGDSENDNSWLWFMTQLRNAYGCPRDLVIISDEHISIKNACAETFPFAFHCLCAYHISTHLKPFKNKAVSELFYKASRVYKKRDVDKFMLDLKDENEDAHTYLMKKNIRRWSRAYCPRRRYDLMTSNIAENINSRLKNARKLPLCTLLGIMRDMMQRWFYERRNAAATCTSTLIHWADHIVSQNWKDGEHMAVKPINSLKFEVSYGGQSWVVNLEEKSCTCGGFQMDKITCEHACASIRHLRLLPAQFCGNEYSKEFVSSTYAADVNPICHPDEWNIPVVVKDRIVLPPKIQRNAGRPRTSRIPSAADLRPRRSLRCSRCRQVGHNRARCIGNI